jgi:uncharacterized protein YceK
MMLADLRHPSRHRLAANSVSTSGLAGNNGFRFQLASAAGGANNAAMLLRPTILSLVSVGLLLGTSGCGTTVAHTNFMGVKEDLREQGIKVYRGVRFDSAICYLGGVWAAPVLIDIPLSAAADTLLLPFDLLTPTPAEKVPPPPQADRATFVPLDAHYSKDKTRVFYGYNEICGAEPKSFVVLTRDGRWARDDHKAFRFGTAFNVEDLSTFTVVEGDWARDSRAYYSGYGIENGGGKVDCDYATLRIIDGCYAQDKDRAYYCGQPIDGVDLASFVILNGHAEDKNYKYKNAELGDIGFRYKVEPCEREPRTPMK